MNTDGKIDNTGARKHRGRTQVKEGSTLKLSLKQWLGFQLEVLVRQRGDGALGWEVYVIYREEHVQRWEKAQGKFKSKQVLLGIGNMRCQRVCWETQLWSDHDLLLCQAEGSTLYPCKHL